MEMHELLNRGFKGIDLNHIAWVGFNSNTEEVVMISQEGKVARTYKFKGILK